MINIMMATMTMLDAPDSRAANTANQRDGKKNLTRALPSRPDNTAKQRDEEIPAWIEEQSREEAQS